MLKNVLLSVPAEMRRNALGLWESSSSSTRAPGTRTAAVLQVCYSTGFMKAIAWDLSVSSTVRGWMKTAKLITVNIFIRCDLDFILYPVVQTENTYTHELGLAFLLVPAGGAEHPLGNYQL